MKKNIDKQAAQRLHHLQREKQRKETELYMAKSLHRKMKRTFKGIYSYPDRRVLHEVGRHRGENKNV